MKSAVYSNITTQHRFRFDTDVATAFRIASSAAREARFTVIDHRSRAPAENCCLRDGLAHTETNYESPAIS